MFLSQTNLCQGVFGRSSAGGEDANAFLKPDRPNVDFLVGDLLPKYESDAKIITLNYDDALAWRVGPSTLVLGSLANAVKISSASDIDVVIGNTSVGICGSGADFAQVNDWRYVVAEGLDELSLMTTFFGNTTMEPAVPANCLISSPVLRMDWQVRLEEIVSDSSLGLIALLPSDFIYRRGELIFASFLMFLEQVGSFEQTLRRAASFVISFLRSRKGLASLFGAFVTQRSWYLRHSAHPPEVPDNAVDGRFPSKRRTCFRPLPA
jgi:hypothetical protein